MCSLPNSSQKKHRSVPSFVKGLDLSPWPKDVRLVLTSFNRTWLFRILLVRFLAGLSMLPFRSSGQLRTAAFIKACLVPRSFVNSQVFFNSSPIVEKRQRHLNWPFASFFNILKIFGQTFVSRSTIFSFIIHWRNKLFSCVFKLAQNTQIPVNRKPRAIHLYVQNQSGVPCSHQQNPSGVPCRFSHDF